MSHAGQWLNTARRVLAHVRAYLDAGQYGECRDTERHEVLRCVGMADADGSLLTGRHIRVQMHTANAATLSDAKRCDVSAWRGYVNLKYLLEFNFVIAEKMNYKHNDSDNFILNINTTITNKSQQHYKWL